MNYNPDEPAAAVADVLRGIKALRSRCLPILREAVTEGCTIESAEFVDGVKEFAAALIDFGCEISPPAARAAAAEFDVQPPSFCLAGECEPLSPHLLLTKVMLWMLQRVFEEAGRYAYEVGRPDEDAKLWRLSATAVISGESIGLVSRLLIVWNSERAGRSNAAIADQFGIPVDHVPPMIATAKAYLVGCPKSLPADPSCR